MVMGNNPSCFSSTGRGRDKVSGRSTDQLPVENVLWLDAIKFCNKLSEMEGKKPFYEIDGPVIRVPDWNGQGYRLPTEAEWEYACRAENSKRYSFGDDPSKLRDYAWYDGNSSGMTHFVRQKQPNAFGLYDMHGNVWEWCWDNYDGAYYARSPVDDPPGASGASGWVIRGGCWLQKPPGCRSAIRGGSASSHNGDLGFRLARGRSAAAAGGSGGPHTSAPEVRAQRLVEKPPVPTAAQALDGFQPLFNGKDLNGWVVDGLDRGRWLVINGELLALGETYKTTGWLLTDREYKDFRFRCEFLLTPGSSAGFVFRAAPGERSPHLKLADDKAMTSHFTGSILWSSKSNVFQPPQHAGKLNTIGEWNELVVEIRGNHVLMEVNGALVNSLDLKQEFSGLVEVMPRLKQSMGRIGFQKHTGKVHFRNIEIKELNGEPVPTALNLVSEAGSPPVGKPTASSTDALQLGTSWRGTATALSRSWTNDVAKPRALWLTIKARKGTQFKAAADSIGGSRDAEGTFKDGVIDWKVAKTNSSWEGKLVGNELVGTFKGTHEQGDSSGEFRLKLADGLPPRVVPARVPPIGPARGARYVRGAGWTVEGDQLIKKGLEFGFVGFGDPDWTDYDLTFEARMVAGPGDFGACFRTGAGKQYLLMLGGYGNKHLVTIEESLGNGRWRPIELGLKPGTIQPFKWYKLKISLLGPRIRIELDDHLLFALTDESSQKGSVQLRGTDCAVRFRNIKVSATDGTVLWEGPPDLP